MNGPRIVCHLCQRPTQNINGFCDGCLTVDNVVERCLYCEQGRPRDKTGLLHLTATGGYMGKCDNPKPHAPTSSEGQQ